MPGIVGIISRRPAAECERLVRLMTNSMMHESFYTSGSFSALELGVYGGWVAFEDSFSASQPFFNEPKDVILLFSGECFAKAGEISELSQRGHEVGPNAGDWLVH